MKAAYCPFGYPGKVCNICLTIRVTNPLQIISLVYFNSTAFRIYSLYFRALSVDVTANLKWFCFTQKQMDINAAIQALIESHTALQMEVIYLALFTLARSIYKLNRKVFRSPKCGFISKIVFKTD